MRIDLSPKGQVIGTRRVSSSGDVSGLSEHAGKDVLILIPNGRPLVKNTVMDYLHQWESLAEKNVKVVAKEWKAIQKKLPRSSDEALALAKDQLELAKEQLDLETLIARIPSPKARRVVKNNLDRAQSQMKRAQTQVQHARKWIDTRFGRKPTRKTTTRRTRRVIPKVVIKPAA